MTTADETAAALRASMAINQGQQEMVEESRLLLTAMLRTEMRDAVAEGISAALTDEAAERFWAKGLEVLQRQATERTGRFVLSSITSLAKKLLLVGVLVALIYSVGGWSLLKAVWAAAVNKG